MSVDGPTSNFVSPVCRVAAAAIRSLWSITARYLVALGVVGLTLFSSCMAREAPRISQVPFTTLDKGVRSGIRERTFVVVTTQSEWDKLWRTHQQRVPPEEAAPIDFQQDMVVAAFAGEKPTGGYGIEVRRIEEDSGASRLRVVVNETHPMPDAMVTQVITQPFHIVKARRINLPAAFTTIGNER